MANIINVFLSPPTLAFTIHISCFANFENYVNVMGSTLWIYVMELKPSYQYICKSSLTRISIFMCKV